MEGTSIRNTTLKQRIITTAVMAVTSLFWLQPVLADQFDQQIAALNQQIVSQRNQINQLQAQANTLNGQIASLNGQIAEVLDHLQLAQVQLQQVDGQLAANEQQLAQQKDLLANDLRVMYLQGQTSTLEILASSGSFSDFLDQQQYLQSLKDHVQTALDAINATETELKKEQQQQQELIGQQQVLENNLASQRAQVANLLAQTQSQEAAYQQQTQNESQQVAKLRAQQAAAIAAASHQVGSAGGCGGYPSNWCLAPQDSIIDSWGMFNRECVSYAAWATAVRFGHYMPYWGGSGNANQWPGDAEASGIPVDRTPEVGAVGIYMGGAYGHAMIVERIDNGGSSVLVSSFNARNTGQFEYDEWPTSSLYFIHFR